MRSLFYAFTYKNAIVAHRLKQHSRNYNHVISNKMKLKSKKFSSELLLEIVKIIGNVIVALIGK